MLFTLELTLEELRSVRALAGARASLAADDESRARRDGHPAGVIEGHAETRERAQAIRDKCERAEAGEPAPVGRPRAALDPWVADAN